MSRAIVSQIAQVGVVAFSFAFSVAPAEAQLAAKSPFMPAQAAVSTGPTAGAPLEYRGYMETGEGVQFRLYDPVKKQGTWVKLNERNNDYDVLVKQHDTGQQTLTIEYQGKTLTLEERKAKIVSSGAAAPPVPIPATPVPTNIAPAVTQPVVLNPTPADEQRRLEAVATEVARRRALREQATQQMNQGQVPPVAVPSTAQPVPQRNFQMAVPPGNLAVPPSTNISRPGPVPNGR